MSGPIASERDCLPRKSWSAPTMLSASDGILRVTARSLVPVDVIERVSRLWCRCKNKNDAQQRRTPLYLG